MNDYSFGVDPRIKEIVELLQQAKQNQQQQERPTDAQIVSDRTLQGVDANINAYQQQAAAAMSAPPTPETQQAVQAIQQQPQQQPPQQLTTPEQWRLMNQISEQKGIYEGADAIAKAANPKVTDGAQLDAIANSLRTGAHNNADLIRQIAKETGIDLSGIEDVSYADAQRNLQTRQTKEVADILSGRGKYGRNSDQYYNDQVSLLHAQGKSLREAQRIAGDRAQRYQYDRVSYLRNAYNMYGRDGNYTNENGVPILQEIAMEMPDVAGVYANAYKLPTHLQDRADTLEDKAIAQANQLEQIAAQTEGNSRLQAEQGVINANRDKTKHGYDLELKNAEFKHEIQKIEVAAKVSFDNWLKQNEVNMENKSNEYLRQVQGYHRSVYWTALQAGGSEKEASAFADMKTLQYVSDLGVGKGSSGGTRKGTSKGTEPKYTDKQQVYMRNMKNLIVQAKADPTNTELIDQLETLFRGGDELGVEGNKDSVKALDFPVETYQKWEDIINALRGMSYKVKADDNNAALYFSKVRDVQLLEDMYPNYNWDDYWKRRGGKPK